VTASSCHATHLTDPSCDTTIAMASCTAAHSRYAERCRVPTPSVASHVRDVASRSRATATRVTSGSSPVISAPNPSTSQRWLTTTAPSTSVSPAMRWLISKNASSIAGNGSRVSLA
jgi:hypothetical protein